MKKSVVVAGKIVGSSRGKNGLLPRVAYSVQGTESEFTSKYGGGTIQVGRKVQIAYNRTSRRAEILNATNRWVWTLVPLGLAVVILLGTFLKYG